MTRYVADTHSLYWYLSGSNRLGAVAKAAFDEGASGTAQILIPVIVLAELYFLNEKLGRPLNFPVEVDNIRASGQFRLAPLMPEDILEFAGDARVPEMHDRIIVGVARRAGATCITKDADIVSSRIVATVW